MGLHGAEGRRALLDKVHDNRGQVRVGYVAVHGVERRRRCDVALPLGVSHVGVEAPGREADVDLQRPGVDHIGQGESGAPNGVLGLGNPGAQVGEEGHESVLLRGLRGVVGGPVLGVCLAGRVGAVDGRDQTREGLTFNGPKCAAPIEASVDGSAPWSRA